MKKYLVAVFFAVIAQSVFAGEVVKDVFGKEIRIPAPPSGIATCEIRPEMLKTMQASFAKQNISSVLTCFHAPVVGSSGTQQIFLFLSDLQNKDRKMTLSDMKNQKEIYRTGFGRDLSATYRSALEYMKQTTPYYRDHYDTLVREIPAFKELYNQPDGYFVYSTDYPLFGELGPEKTVLYITGMIIIKERFFTLTSFTTKADREAYDELVARFKEWIQRIEKENAG